ncbi:zinc-dependent alcohol dehydrogenase family protein [Caldilinea sp.]|jgi:propanol-preferring alcohol dehydrogenase|uniref:zinc-dependent alcohol dehydrogenase family protein n=1 Tax=Caldilinea sp. TaxID=2293560 RepID=UPI00262AB884|nr:zinc-dependent alcohol dehydrogenase family protein [Caldilinea sp.]
MRAMQLFQTGDIVEDRLILTEDAPLPQPAADELRVRVHVCGVCRTDLHTVEGDLTLPRPLPLIPGHQVVGVVDAVGEQTTHFAVGDRVGVGWMNWTCGACDFCRRGQENLCPYARFTGLHVDGGYAQWMLVHERFAYRLPADLSDEAAAPLLCGGVIGYRTLRLSGVEPGGRLGLYGFGASAHQAIQVARHWGCTVYVFTRGEEHRRLAEALGAAWVGDADEQPPQPLDAAAIFAPAGWIVERALHHVRPGAVVAINAIHMTPIPELPYERIYGERVLRSVANFTRQDAEEFLKLAAEIPIRTEVETFGLAEANQALRKLKQGELRAAAVLRID